MKYQIELSENELKEVISKLANELDKSYYDNAIKRINERTNWQSLF